MNDLERARNIAVALEQENADLRERIREALAIVEAELPEACYTPLQMEYGDDYPCARCALRNELIVPDAVTLDVIAARSTAPNRDAA